MSDDDQTQEIMNAIKNNSTINESGVARFTTKENYYKMAQDIGGIPKKQIVAVAEYNNAVIDASVRVAADDLAEDIKEYQANGDDPSDLKREVRITTHGNRLVSEVHAQRSFNDPKNPGEKIKRVGSVRISVRQSSTITKSSAEYASNLISSLLE